MRKNRGYILIIMCITAIDQLVKLHAEKSPESFREIIHNKGFAGERLKNKPEIVRMVSAVLTVFGISMIFLMPDKESAERLKKYGLSMLMGGALSNTLDRLFRHYVVDYIPKGKYVYNLGDFAIFAGCAGVTAGSLMENAR